MPGPERVLSLSGELVENARGVDAGTEGQVGCRSGPGGCATWVGEVNGPEGETLDWSAVDWPVVEDRVQRLRQRIFTVSHADANAYRACLSRARCKSHSPSRCREDLCRRQRLDLIERVRNAIVLDFKLVPTLQVQPKPVTGSEI